MPARNVVTATREAALKDLATLFNRIATRAGEVATSLEGKENVDDAKAAKKLVAQAKKIMAAATSGAKLCN